MVESSIRHGLSSVRGNVITVNQRQSASRPTRRDGRITHWRPLGFPHPEIPPGRFQRGHRVKNHYFPRLCVLCGYGTRERAQRRENMESSDTTAKGRI